VLQSEDLKETQKRAVQLFGERCFSVGGTVKHPMGEERFAWVEEVNERERVRKRVWSEW